MAEALTSQVFISYSYENKEPYLKGFSRHLKPMCARATSRCGWIRSSKRATGGKKGLSWRWRLRRLPFCSSAPASSHRTLWQRRISLARAILVIGSENLLGRGESAP